MDSAEKQTNQPSNALETLFWRDEILQVLFWLKGEQLASHVTAKDLEVFLDGSAKTIEQYLERFVEEGLLVCQNQSNGKKGAIKYSLSKQGEEEGGRRFADAFSELQKQGHGVCTDDCDCSWEVGHDPSCPSHSHHDH